MTAVRRRLDEQDDIIEEQEKQISVFDTKMRDALQRQSDALVKEREEWRLRATAAEKKLQRAQVTLGE